MILIKIFKINELIKTNLSFLLLLICLIIFPLAAGGTDWIARNLFLILPLLFLLTGFILKEFNFKNIISWQNILWFIFLFFIFSSTIASVSIIRSLPEFFQFLSAFLFFQLFLLTAQKENLRWLAAAILATGFILVIISFYYFLPWVAKPTSAMNLFWANYGHSHLADYLILAIPFLISFFLTAREKKKEILWGGLLGFYLLAFTLTFSRAAFLSLSLITLFLLLFLNSQKSWKKTLVFCLALFPIMILFLSVFFSLHPLGIKAKTIQPNHWLVKQLVKPELHSGRVNYWTQTWEGFLAKPLFGWGWGTFELVSLQFQKIPNNWSKYAHNFYLQILVENGIFAFLALLIFLTLCLVNIWRLVKKNKDPVIVGAFAAVLTSSLHSFFDYDWHFPAVFLTFLALLANLIVLTKPKQFLVKKKKIKIYPTILIIFAVFSFVFFVLQQLGVYFLLKDDYKNALRFTPWFIYAYCKSPDKYFQNVLQTDEIAEHFIYFKSQDSHIYSCIAQSYLTQGESDKAEEYLKKAIYLNPLGNIDDYKKLIKIYDDLDKNNDKENLKWFLASKIRDDNSSPEFGSSFAKIFYVWGKEYLEQKDYDKTIFWWQKAIQFLPEWDYFHLELASLYFKMDYLNQGRKTLENCLKFKYAQDQCLKYIDKRGRGVKLEEPGSWQDQILKIPD